MLFLEFLFSRYMDDWDIISRAVIAFWSGQNPYLVGEADWRFYNPIWTVIPLTPIAILPSWLHPITIAILALLSMVLIARHYRYRGLNLVLLLLSPALWLGISHGNIDWLVMLGVIMPAPLGVLFLGMKPQATFIAIAVILLGSRKRVLAGILLAIGIAWWIGGYGLHFANPGNNPGNMNIWPLSLIPGIPIAIYALIRRSVRAGLVASVLCAPYVTGLSALAVSVASPIGGFLFLVFAFVIAQIRSGLP